MSIIDNIRDRRKDARGDPVVNMDQLAKTVAAVPKEVAAYAPKIAKPEELPDMAIRVIERFAELPTGELDELMRAAEDGAANLKNECQELRNYYTRRYDELSKEIKAYTARCKLAKETVGQKLRDQMRDIDGEETPEPPQAA